MVLSSLPPEYQQFVQDEISSGRFRSAEEVVCEALRELQQRRERLAELRREIEIGVGELERGEGIRINSEAELQAFFDDIEARGQQRLANQTP